MAGGPEWHRGVAGARNISVKGLSSPGCGVDTIGIPLQSEGSRGDMVIQGFVVKLFEGPTRLGIV